MGPDKLAAALYIHQQCIISAWEDMVSDRSVDYYGRRTEYSFHKDNEGFINDSGSKDTYCNYNT